MDFKHSSKEFARVCYMNNKITKITEMLKILYPKPFYQHIIEENNIVIRKQRKLILRLYFWEE